MDQNIYDKINQATDIVALVSEYVNLTKRGKNYMGLCPFHDEKSPSFSVTPEKQLAYCFGCHKGGSPITFLSQIKNISTHDAAVELGEKVGIYFEQTKKVIDPYDKLYDLMKDAANFYNFALKNSESGKIALSYLEKRKLSSELITHFNIGYAPDQVDSLYKMLRSKKYSVSDMMRLGLVKQNESGVYYDVFRNRITFPIANDKGDIVGFSGRSLNPKEKAKYINSTETDIFKKGLLLYHYSDSIRAAVKQKHVLLHEGFFDVIASYKSGYEAAVATMGTAITLDQAKLISRITSNVVIAYDGDNAGIMATLKAIPILKKQNLNVSILALKDKLDPDDFVLKYGEAAYQKQMDKLIDPYHFGYKFYQKDKDFKKSDHITKFKQELKQLLLSADPTIIDLYERKAFDELGIQLLISKRTGGLPPKEKSIGKDYIRRSERALDLCIIHLFHSKDFYDQIKEKITLLEIENPQKRELYRDILNYYETNPYSKLDIKNFKQGYTKHIELVDAYIEKIEYKNQMLITNQASFEKILKPFQAYKIQLEIQSLLRKVDNETDEGQKSQYLKKIDKLRKEVKLYEK